MKYQYWLLCLQGVGNLCKRQLIACFGSAKDLYLASEEKLAACRFLKERERERILASRKVWDIDREWNHFRTGDTSFVTVEQSAYPGELRSVHDRPYGLFFRGNAENWREPAVAVVGSRRCSAYGQKIAYDLGYALGEAGITVVSGMAKGIDGAAHRGCLDAGGRAVVVLGCGTDICYPMQNADLYERLLREGTVLSEYRDGTEPLAGHFPARNRIISGLSSQVVVVEAREKSGSLITADFALEQGKDVFAVPGRATDPMSAGCNRLIDQGAGIVCSVEDYVRQLFEGMGAMPRKSSDCGENSEKDRSEKRGENRGEGNFLLEKEERLVYSCLDFYPKGLDQLQGETKLEILPLLAAIMRLCDLGLIRENFKNQYVRLG